MCQPSVKDFAEYFRLSVEAGVSRESDVVAWADRMITYIIGELPDWLLELSTNKEASMSRLLRGVPGDADSTVVWNLVFAGIGLTIRTGKLSREQIVNLMYFWESSKKLPKEYSGAAYRLDDQLDGVAGWGASKTQFENDVDEFFGKFRQFEALIPDKPCHTA